MNTRVLYSPLHKAGVVALGECSLVLVKEEQNEEYKTCHNLAPEFQVATVHGADFRIRELNAPHSCLKSYLSEVVYNLSKTIYTNVSASL